jgi:hypothetical protein
MARNKLNAYDGANAEAARIILADPVRYAGLPLEWARMWQEKQMEPADKFELLPPAARTRCA